MDGGCVGWEVGTRAISGLWPEPTERLAQIRGKSIVALLNEGRERARAAALRSASTATS